MADAVRDIDRLVATARRNPLPIVAVAWTSVWVLVMFAGLRERLALAEVPAAFSGAPIAFVAAGLLSLAFMGFAGLTTSH